jgi:hypothetical protein
MQFDTYIHTHGHSTGGEVAVEGGAVCVTHVTLPLRASNRVSRTLAAHTSTSPALKRGIMILCGLVVSEKPDD